MTPGGDAHGEVRPQAIFLVGFMGAGKSSVGQALGQRLGWPFHDLDERIQRRSGRSIEQIFRESGEGEFRRAEHAELRALLAELGSSAAVVALGGGAFAQAENLALLKRERTVFLDADVEVLRRRCESDGVSRPLLREVQQFKRLYEARRASYLGASLHIETGGKDVETVVAEIEPWARSSG
jgi:shikimate kinase